MSCKIFNALSLPDCRLHLCDPGSAVEDIHSLGYDENGVPYLYVSGKRDVVSEINSYRDECDINRILMRYVNGDITALGDPNGGFYGDVSHLPNSLIDVYKTVDRARDIYDGLDPTVRGDYNSFDDFLRIFGDPGLLDSFLGKISSEKEMNDSVNEDGSGNE